MITLHNVWDQRRKWIGSWEVEPLVYDKLSHNDIGRVVIYKPSQGNNEAGILSSFRDGLVFARFTPEGITNAACKPEDLCFGMKALDGVMK